jgi:hypothetical protein
MLRSSNSPNITTKTCCIPAILQSSQQWHIAFQEFSKDHNKDMLHSSNSPNIRTVTCCVPGILQTSQQRHVAFQQFSKHHNNDMLHSSNSPNTTTTATCIPAILQTRSLTDIHKHSHLCLPLLCTKQFTRYFRATLPTPPLHFT